MNQQVFFKLFACCIPVKGASRTALYDLQRNSFEYIPNILYDLIQECKQFSAAELQLRYPASAWQGISKFLDYLEENEYGFWTSTPECFPDMSLEWDFPGKISNAIIEFVPEKSKYDINKAIRQLEQLRCKYLQIRLFGPCPASWVRRLLKNFRGSYFSVIDLLWPYSNEADFAEMLNLLREEHRIIPLTIYGCRNPEVEKHISDTDRFLLSRVHISSENFSPGKVKEKIDTGSFTINTEFFTEACHFNTGLNRKICIDHQGRIRNHVQHAGSYGDISSTPLAGVVDSLAFRKHWKICNDMIMVCKDCEHRYMCQSNSEIAEKKGQYYKKNMCTYDPYSGQWK
ncbi:MAG: grasp-with-spasm system SPASM domain peptide maturase [Ferruginibacter sp.]